ncbi:hypothetical protein THAOC_10959 [Thalassiosira oceanica]|uniref:tRNA pseudouridine synthase n=1 Tax=Thalassiosira oceanica TaxID=159749 RepID=K0SRA2_THAOC|nr:hypothetical protein THAOC_10959 [Thalassiosira oceanica]|mmetsp:Transcript_38194/g.85896  ORF Transcript_38194/g.85896 Transcript_38194/m.85896 type:complete len:400 (+) Transcript_38194:98-1297(+)|eukprot:EJK67930.1 hypothetical protein THAOC_10959 [Thalassiosira oceanica]
MMSVLTIVLKLEYHGFAYAGFQRQSATRDSDVSHNMANLVSGDSVPCGDNVSGNNKSDCVPRASKKGRHQAPITIQSQIEEALVQWTGLTLSQLRVRGAGRTDKGVHATGQICAFDVPLNMLNHMGSDCSSVNDAALPTLRLALEKLNEGRSDSGCCIHALPRTLDQWQIRRAISTRLPADIIVRSARIWCGERPFEPRQGILRKTYTYRLRFRSSNCQPAQESHEIINAGPSLLRRFNDNNSIWLCPWALDERSLLKTCELLEGKHNFYSFVHKSDRRMLESDEERAIRHTNDLIKFRVDLIADGEDDFDEPAKVLEATFSLQAKGFHRSMVRLLVHFVVDVARGKRHRSEMPRLLSEGDWKGIYPDEKYLGSVLNTAPACGLCLAKVEYEHAENKFL